MEWVSAKFSPHHGQEHKFVLGAEEGLIALCNAKNTLDNGNLIEKCNKKALSMPTLTPILSSFEEY